MVLRLEERRRLAMFDDASAAACGHRLRAARYVANVSQVQVARALRWSGDLAHVEAAEAGKVPPNYGLAAFYWRRLKLSSDFFDKGEVERIPIDIEDRLFAALNDQLDGK